MFVIIDGINNLAKKNTVMKRAIILFLSVLAISISPIKAQFFGKDIEDANKIKSSILGVVAYEPGERILKQFRKDPERLKQYKEEVLQMNQMIKEAMEKEWSFSGKLEFLTQEQADKIIDEKNEDYCLLQVQKVKNYKMNDFYSPNPNFGFNSAADFAYHMQMVGKNNALLIKWGGKPKIEIVRTPFPKIGVSKGGILFMVNNLQNQLVDLTEGGINKISKLKKDVKSRTSKLRDKTLLIPKSLMSKGLSKQIEKEKLNKYYPNKYKVVDEKELDEIILEKNKDYAYFSILSAFAEMKGKELYNYFIVDAEDSRFLFMTGSAVAGANGQIHHGQLMMAERDAKKSQL
ncbi:hypothetical protein [Xanthovirga aplysinae]|uniref:hypothetical protein n=1 Tax=Xanthovirga aplysinae TaxID=2529853 RepID=UPI0012BD5FCB|nr:hypothetical protein [Xanthovirga aplysinae]MTI32625.1 hypothetical protein [Xanthovirga aplysinae]